MPKETHSASYHLLKSDPELNEPPASIAEDVSAADDDEGRNKSPLWKALINLMGEIEGTNIVALTLCDISEWTSGDSSFGFRSISRLLYWSNID